MGVDVPLEGGVNQQVRLGDKDQDDEIQVVLRVVGVQAAHFVSDSLGQPQPGVLVGQPPNVQLLQPADDDAVRGNALSGSERIRD